MTPFPTATRLVEALARGEATAIGLCEAAIERIERLDPAINAVVVRDFDRARAQAREADAALARGERRPLLGLPMTVKESFNVAGLPTTWGFPHAVALPVTEDAVAVQRLKAAGAVILGKTNVPVALGDWQSVNPVYGRTLHPLDPARTPGGSSGGAAAALASGMVPLELGSDIGGSIRVPAAFCGVFGHKPTHGLIPTRGHDFPGHTGAPDTLAVAGPLARSADDLERALHVLAGPDTDEATAWQLALPPGRHAHTAGQRVLVLTSHPSVPTARDVASAVEHLAARLADGGARVEHRSPLLPDLAAAHDTYMGLLLATVTRGNPNGPPPISAHTWLDLMDRRFRLRTQWRQFFEAFDVVLAPAFSTVAFPHDDEADPALRALLVDGKPTPGTGPLAWPGVATLPGLPATAMPTGLTSEGMPIGIQLIGPAFGDLSTIRLAGALS
ncbi:amidase family protein [Rhizobacter sp. Root1221]|uniref:amidase family protein n=1 Tax=Rhizobacter sp. Root1221 TaxID=1736433 RepID=UPI0006FD4E7A|nr:amidase family protein [Rhizobacter sp. Root1221]KQW01268.1 amidase [Rhizobacter sp. Root1221]